MEKLKIIVLSVSFVILLALVGLLFYNQAFQSATDQDNNRKTQ